MYLLIVHYASMSVNDDRKQCTSTANDDLSMTPGKLMPGVSNLYLPQ